MVTVVDDCHCFRVRVEALKLRDALEDKTHADLSGSDDRDDLVEVWNHGACGKVVKYDSHRYLQVTVGRTVSCKYKLMERLTVKYIYK